MPRHLLTRYGLTAAAALLATAWAHAQLLPSRGVVGDVLPNVVGGLTETLHLDTLEKLSPLRAADQLVKARAERITDFVRANRQYVAFDDLDQPAVRNAILVTGADAVVQAALRSAGYALESETIEGLDLSVTRLTVPEGESLSRALKRVRDLAPGADVSADTLYFASGAVPGDKAAAGLAARPGVGPGAMGLIDSGVASHRTLTGPIEQRGFANGAPSPSAHGTAVASLIAGTGRIKGAAPGAPLLVADIYGRDPAGGGALAIVRALGWMAVRGVGIVTVSLVGPDNPLLARAVGAARQRGMVIVAAVGNDGPAAPPAYPASYPGVLAVTGVDGRNKVLIEAGRALHLDFAAPGADMIAASVSGTVTKVRGTSFAAPLVAGRLKAAGGRVDTLAAEAKDMGKKGTDTTYGRGIVCETCRNN
jgi:hypothetical protein